MQNRIDDLDDHVVICGYGRIGVMLARELAEAKIPLVVLERSPEKLAQASEAGHLCLTGDATLEEVLLSAGIAPYRRRADRAPRALPGAQRPGRQQGVCQSEPQVRTDGPQRRDRDDR